MRRAAGPWIGLLLLAAGCNQDVPVGNPFSTKADSTDDGGSGSEAEHDESSDTVGDEQAGDGDGDGDPGDGDGDPGDGDGDPGDGDGDPGDGDPGDGDPGDGDGDPGCGAPSPLGRGACPPSCTGGCDAGVCTIDCTSTSSCGNAGIACPPGWPCVVACHGTSSCQNATITC